MTSKRSGKVPSFELRDARAEDYPFAERLYLETGKLLFEKLGVWNESKVISRFKQLYKLEEVQVIRVEGVDAGWLQTSETEHELSLLQIHLIDRFRSGGIGSQLIGDLLRNARAKDKAASLFVIRNNPAIRLYLRFGFKIVSEGENKLHLRWEPNTQTDEL